jgi:hypothetical protein
MQASTTPTHRDPAPTEAAAARRASSFAESLEGRVLAAVVAAGDRGLTAREAREVLGLPVEKQYSVSPRLSALVRKSLLEPSGDARDSFMVYTSTPAGRIQAGAR